MLPTRLASGSARVWGVRGLGLTVSGVRVEGLGALGSVVSLEFLGRALGHFIFSLIGLKRILPTNIFH